MSTLIMDVESNSNVEKDKIDVPKMEGDISATKCEPVTSAEEEKNCENIADNVTLESKHDSESNESLRKDIKDVTKIEADDSVTNCKPDAPAKKENESENVPENVSYERKQDLEIKCLETDKKDVPKMEADVSVSKCKLVTSKEGNKSENLDENELDESNLHYENDICIYTDPETKSQFVWDESKQEWVPRDTPDSFADKDYEFDGNTYTYTDKETNIKYSWNEDKKEWEVIVSCQLEEDETKMKNPDDITTKDMTQGRYSFEDDTHIYTDPSDGSKYFWDKERNAWFPRVDDDFLARYQMNYGFVDPNANDPKPEEKKEQPPPKEAEKRKAPTEPAWFEVGEETTKVYVSGLPLDITEAEFVELMQKCGLIMRDVDTGKMKVKIYLDPETSLPKGDALCTYIKRESVELAVELLDGCEVRGRRISVERARFTMKGQYNPSLKPKKKRKKDKEKLKKIQEKLFAWMPDKLRGERAKHEKIVIVKNLFQPEMFNKDVKLILEYQQDLREECLKCGAVKKVVIFDRHPEGVAQVNFKEFEAADACVQLLNGRWFGQRKITAEIWDGKTKYKITETDEEIKARLAKWEKFLEAGEAGEKEGTKKVETKDEELVKVETNDKKLDKVETKDEGLVKVDTKDEGLDEECESEKMDFENIQRDSDGDTRSSVESDYDTDEEAKT